MASDDLYGSIDGFDAWHDGLRIRFKPHGVGIGRITVQADLESVLQTDHAGRPTVVRFQVISLTAEPLPDAAAPGEEA
jgi:hypothetical protein